jgi:hypothetical protein
MSPHPSIPESLWNSVPPEAQAATSAHIDETSWSEANEKAWLWVGQAGDLTAFTIADNRGAFCAGAKTAATCRMLLENEGHLWTFLRVQRIEPTNNTAERPLRHAVLWRKSTGGTASGWGSRLVERVLSVAATCRQQGRNILEFLTDCFQARLSGRCMPSLLSRPGSFAHPPS